MPVAFIAGATGYTGRALVAELGRGSSAWTARPHAREESKRASFDAPAAVAVCDPLDVPALAKAMRGCHAVVQLIGTVRKNFADGDYEKIDYGTTVALGEAAKRAGVPRLLLLSSVGAGSPRGRYLRVKHQTEDWVRSSGLEWTIVRPSFIVGPGRRGAAVFGRALIGWSARLRPIEVAELARLFVRALERPDEVRDQILEGASIWKLLEET